MKTKASNSRTEDTGERESNKNSEATNSHNKNSEQDISHEPTNTSNSQENIETNYIEREENVTLQIQEISPETNII